MQELQSINADSGNYLDPEELRNLTNLSLPGLEEPVVRGGPCVCIHIHTPTHSNLYY